MKVDVHQEDERGNVYTLLEPLEDCGLTVPAGFESDGASVPHFLWQLVFPPGDPKALRAAVIHDYIYRTHPAGWTRCDADCCFYDNLLEDGVTWWKAALAFIGVRLFGLPSWNAGGEA